MHSAQCTRRWNAAAVGVTDGTGFTGSRFLQSVSAVSNAGDDGLFPATLAKLTPPFALGSGKLGTPWARMHRAKLSPVWLGAEPQPEASAELA